MIDFTKGLFQSGPFLKIHLNGNWCNINEAEYPQPWSGVQTWIAEHPEYIVAEDYPPAPTTGELKTIARASRNAALAEHDTLVRIALRDQRLGDSTAETRLTQLDAYAEALCDWPESTGFPDLATMPKLSDFIKE